MLKSHLLILLYVIIGLQARAQVNTSTKFLLRGVVVDDISGQPLPYVNIQLINQSRGATSTPNGRFSIDLTKNERLRFTAVNYTTVELSIPDSILDLDIRWVVRLQPKSYQLKEVTIEEDKAIPLMYQSEVFKEKPTIGHLLLSPISYFYYYFGKREKKKRELLSIIEQQELIQHYSYIIGESQIAKLTGLEGEALTECLMYCNAHITLSPKDTESIVRDKLLITLSAYYKKPE